MLRFLSKLTRKSQTATTARATRRAPRRAMLQCEALEDRLVPSASSLLLHSVVDSSGAATAFYTDPNSHNFVEKSTANVNENLVVNLLLANPGEVTAFSAGLDPTGHADVFALKNGVMQEFTNAGGWQKLNEPQAMRAFAAVNGGRLYAVANDNSLWEFTTPYQATVPIYNLSTHQVVYVTETLGGWSRLSGANFISTLPVSPLDAVTQSNGQDALFILVGNGQLEQYTPSTNSWQFVTANLTLGGFSAGLETNGVADVFFGTSDGGTTGNLNEWTAGATHTIISGYFYVLDWISAGRNGNVFFLDAPAGGGLVEWDPSVYPDLLYLGTASPGGPSNLSAAGANQVFVLGNNGALQEYVNPYQLEVPIYNLNTHQIVGYRAETFGGWFVYS